jgi:hypothetical protein
MTDGRGQIGIVLTSRLRVMTLASVAFLAASTSFLTRAWACRCSEPTPRRAYTMGEIVVLGSVESQEKRSDVSVATFVVDHAWKTDVSQRIKITFGKECSFVLENAGRYLLYATRIGDSSFAVRRCRGNRSYSSAGAALKWLRANGRESRVLK